MKARRVALILMLAVAFCGVRTVMHAQNAKDVSATGAVVTPEHERDGDGDVLVDRKAQSLTKLDEKGRPYIDASSNGGLTGCYKMRSYIVRRESHDSDVTRIAGYTTCTPANKIQVKNATATPMANEGTEAAEPKQNPNSPR
jgi:hypothetical protein